MINEQNLQWDFRELANALHRLMAEIDPSLHESLAEEMHKKHVRYYVILKRLDKMHKMGLCNFLHRWLDIRIKFISPHPWLLKSHKNNEEASKWIQEVNSVVFKYLYKPSTMDQRALLMEPQLRKEFEVLRPLLSKHLIKFKEEVVDNGGPINLQRLVYLAATELELKRQSWKNSRWRAICDLECVCDPKIMMWLGVNQPDEAKFYSLASNAFEPTDIFSAREALGLYNGTSRKQTLGRWRKAWHGKIKTEQAWLKSLEKAKQYAKKLS